MPRVIRKLEVPTQRYVDHLEEFKDVTKGVKNVPWRELTKRELLGVSIIRLCILAAAVISIPNGHIDLWGSLPKEAKKEDQVNEAFQKAKALYDAQTLEGKYSLLYINPQHFEVGGEIPGSGILGFFGSAGQTIEVNVGQNCFAGRAYDTTPSNLRVRGFSSGGGDVSAVAAFVPHDGGATVYPAGSNAPALEFTVNTDGMLVPDAQTAATIISYGCEPELGLYEQIGNNFTPLKK